jgi:hypothetical protein
MSKQQHAVLIVTDSLLKFQGQNYPLRNITNFGKFKVTRNKKKGVAWPLLFTLLGLFLLGADDTRGWGAALSIGSLLVVFQRLRKPPSTFLMRVETSSGSAELFQTPDEASVDRTIEALQAGMEKRIGGAPITVDIHNPVFGDKIEGNTGTVVNRSRAVAVK